MPVPATTGQLRTNISDMQVGDYIVCNYQALSGAVGTFSNFGGMAGTEIPVNGTATPNGTFYFVKVDKGLLVADRVIQTSISWDTLNAGKYIQGKPNPTLSPSLPVQSVNASVAPNAGSNLSSLCDGNMSSQVVYSTYLNIDGVVDITFTFSGAVGYLASIAVWIPGSSETQSQSFLVYDDAAGKSLFSSSPAGSLAAGSWYIMPINATVNSNYIRIRFKRGTNSSYPLILGDVLFLTGRPPVIRSLTGGVAYADANGNSSTTDQGQGGWPTNNEWDVYVAGFPTDKIQAGKTLDDVFHWSNVWNWMQDTPITAIATSSNRVLRGKQTLNTFVKDTSNSVFNTYGFRPVFVYQE